MNNYNDIINLPHHESKKYKRMPTINRAAQFTPFAALTGYEDAIEETGRLTTERKEIDEYLKAEINDKLSFLAHSLETAPKVNITYYVPDLRKDGGEYGIRKVPVPALQLPQRRHGWSQVHCCSDFCCSQSCADNRKCPICIC